MSKISKEDDLKDLQIRLQYGRRNSGCICATESRKERIERLEAEQLSNLKRLRELNGTTSICKSRSKQGKG